jgi:hypothetical protein
VRRSLFLQLLAIALGLALAQPACTDTDVFESPGLGEGQADNKLIAEGEFCTEHPDELSYPVKIMFIIDCSQSNGNYGDLWGSDLPPAPGVWSGRQQAVWNVISKYRYDPGVSFAVVRFDSTANVETQVDTDGDGVNDQYGFTNDLTALLRATNSLQPSSGNTSYDAALALAQSTLQMDIDISAINDPGRTKYVVIFISDGFPYPQNEVNHINTVGPTGSIQEGVKGIMNLAKNNIASITFHTALLSSGLLSKPEMADELRKAHDLLTDMLATAEGVLIGMNKPSGNGTFRNFRNGEEINFLDIDYTSVKNMYSIKDNSFIAYNINASPIWDPKSDGADTDGDGLVDSLEHEFGTDLGARDTDGDGFSDLLEYHFRQSGFDPLNPNDAPCREKEGRVDTDGDGLLDCEELFHGTNRELFDTDGDGIPDQIEVRTGTNPDSLDTAKDLDFDGSSNGNEVAWHTNPTLNDSTDFTKWAYRYKLSRIPGIFEGRMCYNFQVENITLMPTGARAGSPNQGYNDVMVYVGQTPYDSSQNEEVFRVACARTRYIPSPSGSDIKLPPSGVVTFEQKNFKLPTAASCYVDAECPYQACDPSNHLCVDKLGATCDSTTACPNFACVIKPNATQGTCAYPVQTTCLTDDNCPFFPIDSDGLCMDAARSSPDPVTKLCPRRTCIPPYSLCPTGSCPRNTDVPPDPLKDFECMAGSCRMPCDRPSYCDPGDTCEADGVGDWMPCTVPADCATLGVGFVCQDQRCRQSCTFATDCTSSWTEDCVNNLCVGHHCVNRHGGKCQGVTCTDASQCPLQVCDTVMGRCRTQPCLESSECSHQHCEVVLGACVGPTCTDNKDCRGDRGYTCNSVVGGLCSRDMDCPVNFCSQEVRSCYFGNITCSLTNPCPTNFICQNRRCHRLCTGNNDCQNPPNDCDTADYPVPGNPNAGLCRVSGASCLISNRDCPSDDGSDNCIPFGNAGGYRCRVSGFACSILNNIHNCLPNICMTSYKCANAPVTDCDPTKEGRQEFKCPQTYCGTDVNNNHFCVNNVAQSCNPDTENDDNNCKAGVCVQINGYGTCDSADSEVCQTDNDCPYQRCIQTTGLCDFPSKVACINVDYNGNRLDNVDNCARLGAGWRCNEATPTADGICILPCGNDSDCPRRQCQGRCIPTKAEDQKRCTNWFDPSRDCLTFD